MKHILALFTFHFSLFTLSASAAVPLRWTVETSRAVPAQFEAYQGETLALEAALQSYGNPLEAPINYSLYWQTNGMGSTYWSVPCPSSETTTNVLFAIWSPTNDVGAKVYNCFIGKPGTIYHAAFQLRLRPSPGATPNELPLPQKVIDFAKVTVLNPPWSGGGGGGVDTNAMIDIIHKTVDGSAKMLPKYLWQNDFDDSHPEAAKAYYRSRGDGKVDGGCSSVRSGGYLYRNFDYPFDERAEFVVKMSAGPNRFASVGVAQVGTNLTEQIVTSGKWSKWYKALPGATVDGINENGVACEINVVGGDPHTSGWATNEIAGAVHPLAAVRWALDNATNAQHAATYLASNIRFPDGWTQNFHWMIADGASTYIVENGEALDADEFHEPDEPATMTNFPLNRFPWGGMGMERFGLLLGGANITNAWFTRAYSPSTDWFTDFGNSAAMMEGAKSFWNDGRTKEQHRGETVYGEPWWQTVHTSIYDITNRTLRVAVQETDDWYTFAVGQANVDLSPIEAQIAALQSGKRDLSDRRCFHTVFVLPPDALPITGGEHDGIPYDWSSYSISDNGELLDATVVSAGFLAYWSDKDSFVWSGGVSGLKFGGKEPIAEEFPATVKRITGVDHVNVIANRDRDAKNALAKFDSNGNLVATSGEVVEYEPDRTGYRTVVTIGSRATGGVGPHSFANGLYVIAEGFYSHAEGRNSHAEGQSSHAEGFYSHAEGQSSHAEGSNSHAEGFYSHAEGRNSHAEGFYSHAEGFSSHAEGSGSHAEGVQVRAKHKNSFVFSGENMGDLIIWSYNSYFPADSRCYHHGFIFRAKVSNGGHEPPVVQNGSGAWELSPDYETNEWWEYLPNEKFYESHDEGTFNINPVGGAAGFWIGETNMTDHIANLTPRYTPSATDPTFSNAVFNATVNSPHLDPVVLRSSATNITVTSHAITTYFPNDTPPHTVEMTATGTRNYKVFIPNEATVRSGLPFEIVAAATAETLGVAWTNEIERLPAMVTVSEPMPGTLIGSVEVFDTGFDWSPSVTSATYDGTLLRVTGEKLHVVRAIRVGTDTSDVSERTYSLVSAPVEASVGSSGVLLDASGNEVGTFTVTED